MILWFDQSMTWKDWDQMRYVNKMYVIISHLT